VKAPAKRKLSSIRQERATRREPLLILKRKCVGNRKGCNIHRRRKRASGEHLETESSKEKKKKKRCHGGTSHKEKQLFGTYVIRSSSRREHRKKAYEIAQILLNRKRRTTVGKLQKKIMKRKEASMGGNRYAHRQKRKLV